jgi:hypothetical protein
MSICRVHPHIATHQTELNLETTENRFGSIAKESPNDIIALKAPKIISKRMDRHQVEESKKYLVYAKQLDHPQRFGE